MPNSVRPSGIAGPKLLIAQPLAMHTKLTGLPSCRSHGRREACEPNITADENSSIETKTLGKKGLFRFQPNTLTILFRWREQRGKMAISPTQAYTGGWTEAE